MIKEKSAYKVGIYARISKDNGCAEISESIENQTTLFVGANNSGKTSAMDALRKFVFNDITLSNRKVINEIGTE